MRSSTSVTIAHVTLAALLGGCGGGGGGSSGSASTAAPVTSGGAAPTTSTTTPGGSSTLPSGVLQVLTYNVAGLPQGISSSNPATNTSQISPKLNAYDLVLVQEDFWYHADLARDAHHAYQTPPLTGYSTLVNDGLNVFSTTPLYGLIRVKWARWHGVFNASNDGLSSKGFSFARHVFGPGVEVDVYDLHADAGRDQGDIDARRDQFDQLADFIEAFSAGRPLLVAGDTNIKAAEPQDDAILVAFMNRLGLRDAARTLGGVESLDRVLLRSTADVELTPLAWRFADEFVDAAGQDLSDHEAVHVTLEWKRLR